MKIFVVRMHLNDVYMTTEIDVLMIGLVNELERSNYGAGCAGTPRGQKNYLSNSREHLFAETVACSFRIKELLIHDNGLHGLHYRLHLQKQNGSSAR